MEGSSVGVKLIVGSNDMDGDSDGPVGSIVGIEGSAEGVLVLLYVGVTYLDAHGGKVTRSVGNSVGKEV